MNTTPFLALLAAAGWLAAAAAPGFAADAVPGKVRVTVVAILASDGDGDVDPKIECIAREVKKLEPKLTGYKQARTTSRSLEVGSRETFELVDRQEVSVLVDHGPNPEKRVGLTVKPTGLGEITYETAVGKCFPIVTRYQTAEKRRLIIAILVKPCDGK